MAPAERVRAGVVRSVNPARREVRIVADAAYKHEFEGREWLRIVPAGGVELRCRVTAMRGSGEQVIAVLTPGVPRDTVALMKGAVVVFAPGEGTAAPGPSWRATEWAGWRVVGVDDSPIGVVAEVFETRANAAFTVRRMDGGSMTLPAIPEVVAAVDRERGVIRVQEIDRFGVEL